jgi:hypothetical protein
MRADLALLDWLEDCLQGARDFVPYTQEHIPDHVAEATAEVQFYTAAVEFVRSGAPAPSDRTSPGTIVINTVLEAADYSINRAEESLSSGHLPAPRVQELKSHRDAWRRVRKFVEGY